MPPQSRGDIGRRLKATLAEFAFHCNRRVPARFDFAFAEFFRNCEESAGNYAATAPAARCAKLVVMKSMNARTRAVRW
jgi:hypothetical protein